MSRSADVYIDLNRTSSARIAGEPTLVCPQMFKNASRQVKRRANLPINKARLATPTKGELCRWPAPSLYGASSSAFSQRHEMATKRREMRNPMPVQLGRLRAMQRSHIDGCGKLPSIGHRTLLGIAAALCWLELTPLARSHLYGDLRRLLDELETEDLGSAA
jgi:hypothetical protein